MDWFNTFIHSKTRQDMRRKNKSIFLYFREIQQGISDIQCKASWAKHVTPTFLHWNKRTCKTFPTSNVQPSFLFDSFRYNHISVGNQEQVKRYYAVTESRTFDRDNLSTLCPLMQRKALYHILLVHNMGFILLQGIHFDLRKRERKYT